MTASNVTRRGIVGGAVAGVGVAAAAASNMVGSARAQSAAKTFVLVHGTFCGGWVWRRVSDLLEQKGHKVFRPTLTGLGERSHMLRQRVDLDTHITDVANLIRWESLKDVCLVVHSYGGWIGSGVLEQVGDRVASTVWLDAFMPHSGQKPLDLTNEAFRKIFESAFAKGEAGFSPLPKTPAIFVNETDQSFVDSKLTPHPVGTYLQPIKLTGARDKVAKKTYIRVSRFPQPAFDKALADCKADPSWTALELSDCGHLAMLDAPDQLTDLIVKAA